MMNPFEAPYWSKLQVELWVCTRSREAVSMAGHAPGRARLVETSIGADGVDDEKDLPVFDDEEELILTAIIRYGTVCSFEDAKREVIVALAEGRLRAYSDPANLHDQFFERVEVLELWGDQLEDSLKDEPANGGQQQPRSARGRRTAFRSTGTSY